MPPRHLDRLTAIDASFLHQEGPESHMHVGALVIAEGPVPAVRGVPRLDPPAPAPRAALPPAPRLPAGELRPPAVDRRHGLQPRVPRALHGAAGARQPRAAHAARARAFSQQLDRSKPLWEMWLIEGLDDGRFGLLTKAHHAMIDGIAGVDLATVLFDLGPEPTPIDEDLDPWVPEPSPTPSSLLSAGVTGMAKASAVGRGQGVVGAEQARAGAGGRARRRRGDRRDRVGGPEPRARDAAERRDRPAPALLRRRLDAVGLQARQERLRRHGQRRRAGGRRGRPAPVAASRAACAPRASSCARSCRCPCARRISAARPATASPRCAGRCRCGSRTRSRGWASCARRCPTSRSPSRRSAPRCSPTSRTSRRRRCSRRPRGSTSRRGCSTCS